MKTLLFCTSYSQTEAEWNRRWRRWYDHHKQIGLNFDHCLIVDDGSPIIPSWDDIEFIHYEDNLGIDNSTLSVPGLYRGFQTVNEYMRNNNYSKLLNIESDAFILSQRLVNYINNINDKWVALWEPKFQIPELGITIAAGSGLEKWFDETDKDYRFYKGEQLETILPFEHVEKNFVGERYGERLDYVPEESDYACQISQHWTSIYKKFID
jgi:hypothetical protein